MKNALTCSLLLGHMVSLAFAQSAAPRLLEIDGITVSSSLRTRIEFWDWFQGNANSDYTFPDSMARLSLSKSTKAFDWQVEFAAPFLLGLPDDALAPGAQGQLGLGASYFAANDRVRNAGMVFAKQGFIRFKDLGGVGGQSGLATFNDVSVDYNLSAYVAVAAYYGRDLGKPVVQAIYPQGKNANFGYLELSFKF